MNRRLRFAVFDLILIAGLSLATGAQAPPNGPPMMRPRSLPPPSAQASGKKTSGGESFFIVGSVDQATSQLLLKRPTEVTMLVKVDANTKFLDDTGKPLKITDFRAGDTVWVTSSGSGEAATAVLIRKGQMTVADLHRYYLDYPEIK